MNSASTSTASLLASTKSSSSSKKDYQQAFGKLSSSFGFGGTMPRTAPHAGSQSHTSSRASSSQPSTTAQQQSQAAYWASQSNKNFEAAFGGLSGSYGFTGNAPSWKSKKL